MHQALLDMLNAEGAAAETDEDDGSLIPDHVTVSRPGFTARLREATQGLTHGQIATICMTSLPVVKRWLDGTAAPHRVAIASVFEALERARPWPGYCQSCKAKLTPPNATSCKACGADDIDD